MTAATLTLADFLLARIAEDEAVARNAVIPAWGGGHRPHPELSNWQYAPWAPGKSGEVEYLRTSEMLAEEYAEPAYVTCDSEGLSPSVSEDVGPHIARHDPARVLAECEAKRRIVESAKSADFWERQAAAEKGHETTDTDGSDILGHLATVYADHPDYDEAWRP